MTFSMIGRCTRTGQFGAVVATSNIAVGWRVPHVAPGVGAVLTQHRTDPRLGPRGLDLLRSGCTAHEALAALVASTPHHRFRQLAVIDAGGRTAHFHGAVVKPALGAAHGEACVAIGNILANETVPAAMVAAFMAAPAATLSDRLMLGLQAGEAAGGEHVPVQSAAMLVMHRESFPYVDLRIDDAPDPIGKLASLYAKCAPMLDEYVVRAIDPENATGVT